MATVVIQGTKIEIPDDIKDDDEKIRTALGPVYPEIASATFTRKNGEIVVDEGSTVGKKG